ncbi:MAG: BT4734/BF3469 family protein, partial [Chitinophagales bacterium]
MLTNPTKPLLVEEFLNKRVSYQNKAWMPFSKEMTISEIFMEIKSDEHKVQVQFLRSLLSRGLKDEYASHKRTLPSVTFCGTFDGERKRTKIKSYNYIIVLDVDKLVNDEINRIKKCFANEPIVFSFWESPSKEGVKGLVSLRYDFELNKDNLDYAHKSAFRQLATFFKERYNIQLDNSGSDTTRLCFFSYDPFIVIKATLFEFEVSGKDNVSFAMAIEKNKITELKFASNKDALFNPFNKNNPGDRYTIGAIIKFLGTKQLSITNSYDEWFKVAMAIANTFTYDVGVKYFLKLSSLDSNKYNEIESKNFLVNCYETRNGSIKFNTIIFLANKKGYM